MPKKVDTPSPSVRKALTTAAKKSMKRVLGTGRTLPKPVEIEPRPHDTPALRALRKERHHLIEELKQQGLVSQDHPTSGNHMADDASEVEEQSRAFALRQNLESMILEIDRAIARADKGTYGICERCGKAIAEERLKAMRSATLCIACAKLQTRPTKAVAG